MTPPDIGAGFTVHVQWEFLPERSNTGVTLRGDRLVPGRMDVLSFCNSWPEALAQFVSMIDDELSREAVRRGYGAHQYPEHMLLELTWRFRE